MEKKKLRKSATDKQISGVAGGIAEYFNIDPTIVRILFVVFTLTGGPGLIAYLIMALVMSPPGTTPTKALEDTWDEATVAFDKAADAVTEVVDNRTNTTSVDDLKAAEKPADLS